MQGRGLTKYDVIKVGEQDASTRYLSENELRFVVPALPSGIDYPVKLSGGCPWCFDIGNFRVDESRLKVSPSSLEIQSGDTATLLFKIDYEAPAGGLAIDVKTNIPNSIIMPEAVIAEGDMTVNIPVKGSEAGEGKLSDQCQQVLRELKFLLKYTKFLLNPPWDVNPRGIKSLEAMIQRLSFQFLTGLPYYHRALATVSEQSAPHWRFLVIDDGSTRLCRENYSQLPKSKFF